MPLLCVVCCPFPSCIWGNLYYALRTRTRLCTNSSVIRCSRRLVSIFLCSCRHATFVPIPGHTGRDASILSQARHRRTSTLVPWWYEKQTTNCTKNDSGKHSQYLTVNLVSNRRADDTHRPSFIVKGPKSPLLCLEAVRAAAKASKVILSPYRPRALSRTPPCPICILCVQGHCGASAAEVGAGSRHGCSPQVLALVCGGICGVMLCFSI